MITAVYAMDEFKQTIREIFWDQKNFVGNAGGADDPDSFRGFGPTEQYWNIPTQSGWFVRYGDNGSDICGAKAPDGTWYVRSKRIAIDYIPGPDETIRYQTVMRPRGWRLKKMVIEYQTGYYTGTVSIVDIFSEEEEQVTVAFVTSLGLKFHFEE